MRHRFRPAAETCKHLGIDSPLVIVLASVRNPLNIGAAARAMANFGLCDLRLVNPYEKAFREAVSAVGGAEVLRGARVFDDIGTAVADCSLVIGTTANHRRDVALPLDRLDAGIRRIRANPGKPAIVFGSEKFGLSNQEMSFCHTLMRIPTVPETPSMNLGQAVAVCLYEYSRAAHDTAAPVPPFGRPIQGGDAGQLTAMLLEVLELSGYTNRITSVSTERKIRAFIRRIKLTSRDVPLLLGILRQILWKFRNVT